MVILLGRQAAAVITLVALPLGKCKEMLIPVKLGGEATAILYAAEGQPLIPDKPDI